MVTPSNKSTVTLGYKGDGRRFGDRDRFLIVNLGATTRIFPLPLNGETVIGREGSEISLQDGSLSRQHARISTSDHDIWIEDLGSTNGTYLNGERINRSKIRFGDEIRFGNVCTTVHVRTHVPPEFESVYAHERWVHSLEDEVIRAKAFARPCGIAMIEVIEHGDTIWRAIKPIRDALGPADHLALYDLRTAELLLCERSLGALEQELTQVLESLDQEVPCRASLACFPTAGTTADLLISSCRQALRGIREDATSRLAIATSNAEELAACGVEVRAPIFISESAKFRDVVELAKRVADGRLPVLISGETGTGKEVVARLIHQQSDRRHEPFIAVNCGALPKNLVQSSLFGYLKGAFTGADTDKAGFFENANRGMLFLDEVGELPQQAQTALLRVLETHTVQRIGSAKSIPVDVRVISATHRNLEEMCSASQFRSDLYYRLNGMTVHVPPLRERIEDVVPLAELFIRQYAEEDRVSPPSLAASTAAALQAYRWPGNVRELKNAVERAVVLCDDEIITLDDLPANLVREAGQHLEGASIPRNETEYIDLRAAVRTYERQLIMRALENAKGNKTLAAERLSIPVRTMTHRMETLFIDKHHGRSRS